MSTQTLIQLKYSTANSAPASLQVGEPAYSYVSNTLFIGTSDGSGVLKIGGQKYTQLLDANTSEAQASTIVIRDVNGSARFNDITANTLNSNTTIYAGLQYANPLGGATNPLIAGDANANNFSQIYVRNVNSGSKASADLIAYPDNGTDVNGWVDLGITSSTFNDEDYTITGPNEGYLFMSAPSDSLTSGNLVIATDSTGEYNDIVFSAGSFTSGWNSVLGHFRAGQGLVIDATTASNDVSSGSLVVKGGAGVAGALRAASIYDNGNRVVTSVTHTAGPGITVSSQTTTGPSAAVTINNNGVLSMTANTGELTANTTKGNVVFGLATTDVSAGSYGGSSEIPWFTVDSFGRLTSAGNTTVSTSFTVAANTGTPGTQDNGGTLTIQGNGSGIVTEVTGSGGNETILVKTDNTVLRSNTSSVGRQTIQTDLTITGNLTVSGTTIYANTQTIQVEDSLIKLASNNTTDAVDIGFYGQYNSGGTKYAGLIRKASDKFYLIKDVTSDPTANTFTFDSSNRATVDVNVTGGTVSGLSSAISVGDGGTGSTSFNTYGVVISGATSTSALTSLSGSAYQVMQLDSDGHPTFGGLAGGTF